jgi:hypothetical protein
MPSSFGPIEPEQPIEQSNFALYVLCKQGELKPREEPRLVNDLRGASTVFIDFEAVPGEVVLGCAVSHTPRRDANGTTGVAALRAPR